MGEVHVPAGMEEDYIRHLLHIAGNPDEVTTSHGPNGVVFLAPDWVVAAFGDRLADGDAVPEWGNGEPAGGFAKLAAERQAAYESDVDDESTDESIEDTDTPAKPAPKRRGRPPVKRKPANPDLKE